MHQIIYLQDIASEWSSKLLIHFDLIKDRDKMKLMHSEINFSSLDDWQTVLLKLQFTKRVVKKDHLLGV